MLAIEIAVTAAAIAVLAAVAAVSIDRKVYQRRKYEAWSRQNIARIAQVEAKAVDLQNTPNFVKGHLLTLGIKLPEAK